MYQLRAYCTNKYTVPSELNLKIRDTFWYPPLHPFGKSNGLKTLVERHLWSFSITNSFQVQPLFGFYLIQTFNKICHKFLTSFGFTMFRHSIRGLLKNLTDFCWPNQKSSWLLLINLKLIQTWGSF